MTRCEAAAVIALPGVAGSAAAAAAGSVAGVVDGEAIPWRRDGLAPRVGRVVVGGGGWVDGLVDGGVEGVEADGLDEVGGEAGVAALGEVFGGTVAGEGDAGDAAAAEDAAHQVPAGPAGELNVADDEVKAILLHTQRLGGGEGAGDLDGVLPGAQDAGEEVEGVFVIVNQQEAHRQKNLSGQPAGAALPERAAGETCGGRKEGGF